MRENPSTSASVGDNIVDSVSIHSSSSDVSDTDGDVSNTNGGEMVDRVVSGSSSSSGSSADNEVSITNRADLKRLEGVFHKVQSTSTGDVHYDVNKLIKLATRHPAKSISFLWQRTANDGDSEPTEREAKCFKRDVDLIRTSHNHAVRQASRRVEALQVTPGSSRGNVFDRPQVGKRRRK